MNRTVLITGATDGIGLETARRLVALGHTVLLHGRSATKLKGVASELSGLAGGDQVQTFIADLSVFEEVEAMADAVISRHHRLDVLINNAGVLSTSHPTTADGLDVRFMVNTIAPYRLSQRLLPLLGPSGRVVNLSSAAQAPVDLEALDGAVRLGEGQAYAQSKLALTMWSRRMALSAGEHGPAIIAVNPGSMLGTKMVQKAYGVAGDSVQVGAEILERAALSKEFASATGLYFDNDAGRFNTPHPDALDAQKCDAVVHSLEAIWDRFGTGAQPAAPTRSK